MSVAKVAWTVVAWSPWRRYREDTKGRSMATKQAGCSDLLLHKPLKAVFKMKFCHPQFGSHLWNHPGNSAHPSVLSNTRQWCNERHLHILSPWVTRLTFNCKSRKHAPGMPLTFFFVCCCSLLLLCPSETVWDALKGSTFTQSAGDWISDIKVTFILVTVKRSNGNSGGRHYESSGWRQWFLMAPWNILMKSFFSMLCIYWEGRLWCGLSLKLRLHEASSSLAQCWATTSSITLNSAGCWRDRGWHWCPHRNQAVYLLINSALSDSAG